MRPAGKKRALSIQTMLLFIVAAVLLLSLCPEQAGLISSAQKKARPAPQKPGNSARPKANPTPTPSALDAVGAPPPVPTLKKQPEQEVTPGDVISVMTTEVLLPVTVRNSNGQLVKDLTRNDFRVFEDNREQPVNDLTLREVPVDAVLMVDASSSVATNIEDFRRAAEGFAAKLNADDRISLIKFDDRVELLQDWTRSRFQLRRALTRIEPGMFTRFNDALLLASRDQFGDTKSRRAVIVLTDGIDSGRGTTTLEGALEALLRAQATIYVVSNTEISRAAKRAELDNLLNGSSSTVRFNQIRIDDLKEGLRVLDQSEKNLEQLATATGGRLYRPLTFQALDSTYAEVADELRHQYGLYYPPMNKTRDGGFRRVRVELTNPSYKAHTRVGYFAPAR
jgi:VWFA-related protein